MLYGSYAFDYHRPELNDNLLNDNLGLIFTRQTKENFAVFTTNIPLGQHKIATPYDGSYCSPLYLYSENNYQETINESGESFRIPNLNPEIVKQIAEKLGLNFIPEKDTSTGSASGENFAPIDLLDYIYAVLHSPSYREKYKEFLKIDFPRVPYPEDQETFWQLVKLGGEIRQIHLLESPKVEEYITQYPIDGDNEVVKPIYKEGKVYINATQYFDNVPEIPWVFCIGGYQPAQKWLKDRKGRQLEFEDILHYQKIIVALSETARLMKEIDKIDFMEIN